MSSDTVILVSWSSWVLFSIAHRHPWGLYTSRQHYWYKNMLNRIKVGMPVQVYGLYWLLVYPLLIISIWLYQRTFESQLVYFIVTLVMLFLAIGSEKITTELFWDRHDFGAAFYINLLIVFPLYLGSLISCGLTPLNTSWQKYPLLSILIISNIWTLYQIYVCYHWPFVSRYYARNRLDIM